MSSATDSASASAEAPTLGPVSATLVAELQEEARKHGVLVWLDKDNAYTELVDSLIRARGDGPAHSSDPESGHQTNGFAFPDIAPASPSWRNCWRKRRVTRTIRHLPIFR